MKKAFKRAEILAGVWNKSFEEIKSEELPKEESWICKYCAVKDKCKELDKRR